MKRDGKTESIAFRITPLSQRWLDKLIEASPYETISDYFNSEIYLRTRELVLRNSMEESKAIVSKEFHLPEKVSKAIDGPGDFTDVYPEDKESLFRGRWFDELKKAEAKFINELGLHDDLTLLSSDEWNKIISFFFNSYPDLKLFLSALYKSYKLSVKEKRAGRKNDD